MSKDQDRTVYRHKDGWAEKRNDSERAGSVHDTQKEAQKAAKKKLRKSGGGELTTQGRDGKFRSKDTISPGNDPESVPDTEH